MDQLSVTTVEDPNTKLNNAVSSTDRALFPQQCKETSNSSSANDQTSSEIHRLAIDTDEEERVKVVSWPGMLHIMIRLRIHRSDDRAVYWATRISKCICLKI